eukprot:sb/3475007/
MELHTWTILYPHSRFKTSPSLPLLPYGTSSPRPNLHLLMIVLRSQLHLLYSLPRLFFFLRWPDQATSETPDQGAQIQLIQQLHLQPRWEDEIGSCYPRSGIRKYYGLELYFYPLLFFFLPQSQPPGTSGYS